MFIMVFEFLFWCIVLFGIDDFLSVREIKKVIVLGLVELLGRRWGGS